MRGVLAQQAAGADVGALGALPHDHHVDLGVARQRTPHARVEPGGPEVDVVVELEAQPQQQAPLEDARREPGVARLPADRAEQDRVVVADLGEHGVGEHLAGGEVALGAEVVVGRLGAGHDLLQHLQRLVDDLRPDAVSRDDRKAHS